MNDAFLTLNEMKASFVSCRPPHGTQPARRDLLDEIHVDLVPVLLGAGIPFFENLSHSPVVLEDPHIVQGTGVTHLGYRVRK